MEWALPVPKHHSWFCYRLSLHHWTLGSLCKNLTHEQTRKGAVLVCAFVYLEGMNELLNLPSHNLLTTIRVPPSQPTHAEVFTSGKFTNQLPTLFKLLCIYDHLGTWPVLFSGKFSVPAGLMTPFNVSVAPIYSFSTNWIDCCRNCTETSQNISDFCFPRTRLPVVLSQLTAISWHLFQLQLPSCVVHCWEEKGKGQVLSANPQPPGMTVASFLPWSWSASPDASQCV